MSVNLLTVNETAELFGVKPQTVRRWVNGGLAEGTYIRTPSGRVRFLVSEIGNLHPELARKTRAYLSARQTTRDVLARHYPELARRQRKPKTETKTEGTDE